MNLVKAVTTSENAKIGRVSTTYAAQTSCPSSCVFKDGGGCYAERGFVAFHTRNMNKHAITISATILDVAQAEADAIDGMKVVQKRPMRLHTVGDCSSDAAAQLVAGAVDRYQARGGGPVWTYTHAWRDVSRESWGNVSVLASCESEIDVVLAKARGYATAIVVDEFPDRRRYSLGEIEVLPCPAQTKHGVQCVDCQLCFDDSGIRNRDYSIGFAIHGDPVTKKRPSNQSTGRRKHDRVLHDRYRTGRWRDALNRTGRLHGLGTRSGVDPVDQRVHRRRDDARVASSDEGAGPLGETRPHITRLRAARECSHPSERSGRIRVGLMTALTKEDFERIEDEVCDEDRHDILENGWTGGRNGYEQAQEILDRIRTHLGVES